MSEEKISTKVLSAIFATGILSFCGVAGEGIFSNNINSSMGHNHLPISRCLCGTLISLSKAFL